jgi:hypothetical protein
MSPRGGTFSGGTPVSFWFEQLYHYGPILLVAFILLVLMFGDRKRAGR